MNFLYILHVVSLSACHFLSQVNSAPEPLELSKEVQKTLPEYLKPFPYTEIPEGLPDISAKTCGNCHREIYQEWKISTHAHAYKDDLQFMAELAKTDPNDPTSDVTWMCMNCHTPLINQQESLIVDLSEGLNHPQKIPNPFFDADLQIEAITCASCHVREGKIIGPYGNPDNLAPHPVQKSTELTQSSWCNQCHQAEAHFPEINLGCFFTTGKEHAASPYQEQTCQDCHMPEIERSLAIGTPKRKTRYHYFGGSLIPKQTKFIDEIKLMESLYTSGLELGTPQVTCDPIEKIWNISFSYKNASAGHYLPSGDPERYLLYTVEILDKNNTVLAKEEFRIGTEYQWWPSIQKISDNRLAPLEERIFKNSFSDPESQFQTKGVWLQIRVEHWRISPKNLEYHQLEDKVPAFRLLKEVRYELKQMSP